MYGIMYGMRKTTVYLPDEMKSGLARLARSEGKSEAALIREAVAETLGGRRKQNRPKLPLFASGQFDLAERVDEALGGFGKPLRS